jgi:hypothetical protein
MHFAGRSCKYGVIGERSCAPLCLSLFAPHPWLSLLVFLPRFFLVDAHEQRHSMFAGEVACLLDKTYVMGLVSCREVPSRQDEQFALICPGNS